MIKVIYTGPSGNNAVVSGVFFDPAVPVPVAPSDVNAATSTGATGPVTVTWTGSPGATSYNVKRSTNSGCSYNTIANVPAPSSSYVDNNVAAGTTYYYVVSAVNAGGESEDSLEASVTLAPAAPDFSISASPSSRSVKRGTSTTYTVAVWATGGFTGTVNLSVNGPPSRATATFNLTSVPGSGTSTLTITTSPKTPTGTFPLTITGASGTLSHTVTVSLIVTVR